MNMRNNCNESMKQLGIWYSIVMNSYEYDMRKYSDGWLYQYQSNCVSFLSFYLLFVHTLILSWLWFICICFYNPWCPFILFYCMTWCPFILVFSSASYIIIKNEHNWYGNRRISKESLLLWVVMCNMYGLFALLTN
jgi:hypothetical protein